MGFWEGRSPWARHSCYAMVQLRVPQPGNDASVAVTGYCPHLHRIPAQTHGTGIVLPAKYRDHPFGTSTTKCLQCSGRQAMESSVTRLVTFM